jgi:hypothetical protein
MALPLSGQISMSDIRFELGVLSQSPFGLNEARSGTYVAINSCSTFKPPSTGQIRLSDWYGYDHAEACPTPTPTPTITPPPPTPTPTPTPTPLCEITVNLNVSDGGGASLTYINDDTLVEYTVTAFDATGAMQVPAGSYTFVSYVKNVPCPSPLMPVVTPLNFTSGCNTSVQVQIGCA